jgi:hypothetical protein
MVDGEKSRLATKRGVSTDGAGVVLGHLLLRVDPNAGTVLPGEANFALDHHAVPLWMMASAIDNFILFHRLNPFLSPGTASIHRCARLGSQLLGAPP